MSARWVTRHARVPDRGWWRPPLLLTAVGTLVAAVLAWTITNTRQDGYYVLTRARWRPSAGSTW